MTTTLAAAPAQTPPARDLTQAFVDAGVKIDRLLVVEVGGIVVIRGRAADKALAADVSRVAQELGHARVANLIQVHQADDVMIRQRAERELAIHRSLDGCRFRIDSRNGILHVNGQVRHELQKDVAVQLLRSIDGVRELRLDLVRF